MQPRLAIIKITSAPSDTVRLPTLSESGPARTWKIALEPRKIPTDSPIIAVDVLKKTAIMSKVGRKLFIASAEMLDSSINVSILGWVELSRKREVGFSLIY